MKSHEVLESRLLDAHVNYSLKEDMQGESSFVVKPYIGDKKEHIEETISTWLGHWEFHFELHPTSDHANVSHELGGIGFAWDWCMDDFVNIFKKQLLQPPFEIEPTQHLPFLAGNFLLLNQNQVSKVKSGFFLA